MAYSVVTVGIEELRDLLKSLLVAAGCEPRSAAIATDVFVEADLRGFGFQGLEHVPLMIDELRGGKVSGSGEPRIMAELEAIAHVDGCRAPGPLAGIFASDVAVRKAKKAGSCTVGIVNSGDMFMLGYYVERMAREGLVGIALTNAGPRVHPFGGTDKVLGTNPVAIAVPTAAEHPIVLDFATSIVAGGRIRQAAYHNEKLPLGYGLDRDGVPTQNADEIWRGGAISPMSGAKGYGLSLCVALLSGPLVGGGIGKELTSTHPGAHGHLFMAIDPRSFGDPLIFQNAVSAYVGEIKKSRKAPGVARIRVPGERGFEEKQRQLRARSIEIDEIVWTKTSLLARELKVAMPSLV